MNVHMFLKAAYSNDIISFALGLWLRKIIEDNDNNNL